MKTISTLLLLSLLASASFAQTIRRVNNNTGIAGVNVYSTAQAAHDAASANDIIVLEPSGTSYGDLILTKPLKIYGNGYFLDVNSSLKADTRSSNLSRLTFNTGSGGSTVYGVSFTLGNIYGVSNITIQRCYISGAFGIYTTSQSNNNVYANVSNINFSQNYFSSSTIAAISAQQSGVYPTISNISIANNIFNYLAFTAGAINAKAAYFSNWVVNNNTFYATGGYQVVSLSNSVFTNNLITGQGNSSPQDFLNVSSSYNVSDGSFAAGTGNQSTYIVSNEFLNPTQVKGISSDALCILKSSSPLKTAGSGGIEVGAFGGSTPYIISGVPAIPAVLNMTQSAIGSSTLPLQVTVSVKSNN